MPELFTPAELFRSQPANFRIDFGEYAGTGRFSPDGSQLIETTGANGSALVRESERQDRQSRISDQVPPTPEVNSFQMSSMRCRSGYSCNRCSFEKKAGPFSVSGISVSAISACVRC